MGLDSSDKRLLSLASVMMESQMLKIVSEMKTVSTVSKPQFSFEDLQKSMTEFGVALKRPAFISEKTH